MFYRQELIALAEQYLPDERLENFKIFFREGISDTTSARMFLLGTIDALVDKSEISEKDAADAYEKIGFSPTQMKLIREWFLSRPQEPAH